MVRPDGIPETVWTDAAKWAHDLREWAAHGNTMAVYGDHDEQAFTDTIARAILAEREAHSFITSGTMKNMETDELFSAVYRMWPIRKPEVIKKFPDTNAGLAAARAMADELRKGAQ
jgi:hypothetical protein